MQSRFPLLPLMLALASLLAACSGSDRGNGDAVDAADARLPKLAITVFAAPSQSIWLPTLIQELGLDRTHGFRLQVKPKPSTVAYTDFATGADPVCFCSAPSAVARFVEQGADIALLWNVFNLDYFIATRNPEVRSLKDLEGRVLAADTATGGWAVASWLLQQNGVELDRVRIRSSSNFTASLTELSLGRLDAMQAGMINLATLATTQDEHGYRVLDLNQTEIWGRQGSSPGIPSIAFGVWRSWLRQEGNEDLVQRFYRANLDAAAYLRAHPEDAARRISARTGMAEPALLHLFRHRSEMIDIRPISEYRDAVRLLTQELLPAAGILKRPLTDAEFNAYVSDFHPRG